MTRWKREYREWAKREQLGVYMTPRHWSDWSAAKVMSRVVSAQAKKDEAYLLARLHDALLYGMVLK